LPQGRVLGVVPARLGSTRFPAKVLAPLAGRPLVEHAVGRLALADSVDDVLVATDSDEVVEAVRGFGGHVVLVTGECATGSDRAAVAIRGLPADIVINLQADQPLIDPADIDRTVELLASDQALDIATLAFRDDSDEAFASPHVVKTVIDSGARALYFSRAPIPASAAPSGNALFLHHVGIYSFRRSALERFALLARTELEIRESLEQLRAIENGMSIGVVVTEHRTAGVDRPEDLALLEKSLGAS